jgi:hypothetical protein
VHLHIEDCSPTHADGLTATLPSRSARFAAFINSLSDRYTSGSNARPSPRSTPLRTSVLFEKAAEGASKPSPPCWLRLKKKLRDYPSIKKYRGDLALGFEQSENGLYDILVVPRFKVQFENDRRRACRRLITGKLALGFKGVVTKKNEEHRFLLDDDEVFEPFVLKGGVPFDALDPQLSIRRADIAMFYHGMIDFWRKHPSFSHSVPAHFLQVSCELFLRAPLEVDERVEVVSGDSRGVHGYILNPRGIGRVGDGDTYTVEVEGIESTLEVEGRDLRRRFKEGDDVEVHFTEEDDWRGATAQILKLFDNGRILISKTKTLEEVRPSLPFKTRLLKYSIS